MHRPVVNRLLFLLLALLPSCNVLPRAAPAPVATIEAGKRGAKELVVFLPGRWSRIEEFEREEFFTIAARKWPQARLVAADLHLGYYKNRSMAKRLHDDIIGPARKSGVETVRIVGISMGGLGALIYDTGYPGQADELILLSPFVGEEKALREIASAGGVRRWKPGPVNDSDFSRKLWLRLREQWLAGNRMPDVMLGCGKQDRLVSSNRLFAAEFLEPALTVWQDGGHDWPTWRDLLRKME